LYLIYWLTVFYLIFLIEFRKGVHHIEAGALGYITSAERYELED